MKDDSNDLVYYCYQIKLFNYDVMIFCCLHRDLSQTSITKLPTYGLEKLEVLKIQETFTLKEFPSIYDFHQIEEAFLTYPYHCCAFIFPKTHNPIEHARNQFLEEYFNR